MKERYFKLQGHEVVPCVDVSEWARWFEHAKRVVRQSRADVKFNKQPIGIIEVSTVFLGLDHQFGDGAPLLFETIVFGGPLDGRTTRCTTWAEAEIMHDEMCALVKTESEAIKLFE